MTVVVTEWRAAEAVMLQQALRMTNEAFAERLGAATRTVAKWRSTNATVNLRTRSLPSAGMICLSNLSRYTRSVDGLKPASITCDHHASANSLTLLSRESSPDGPGRPRSRTASERALRAALSVRPERSRSRVLPS